MKNLTNWLRIAYLLAIIVVIMLGFSRALPLPLQILAAVVLLGIPFVREFLPRRDVDERQLQISHFSGSMALYAYLALLLTVIIKDYLSHNQPPGDALLALLIIPLAVKLFISLLQNLDPVQAARCITLIFAGMWLIFAVLSHDTSIMILVEIVPFLVLIALAFAVPRWPRVCGVLLIALGLAAGFTWVWMQKSFYGALMMFTFSCLPLILSGSALLFPKEKEE